MLFFCRTLRNNSLKTEIKSYKKGVIKRLTEYTIHYNLHKNLKHLKASAIYDPFNRNFIITGYCSLSVRV